MDTAVTTQVTTPEDTDQELIYRWPHELLVDHSINISRAGKRHDPETTKALAERFLDVGQTQAVEVFKLPGDPPDAPWRLGIGFGRWEAASYIVLHKLCNDKFDGRLACRKRQSTLLEITLRNLDENIHRVGMSPIDTALAIDHLVSPPEAGGLGEDIRVVASRMKLKPEEITKLRKLCTLIEPARDLIRLNYKDAELGIDPGLGHKLANKPQEMQQELIDKAKDATGRVTPKAMRAVLAPKGGRQGQPEAVTGASLSNVIQRLERLAKTSTEMKKKKIEPAAIEQSLLLLRALLSREAEDFDKLGALGTVIKAELEKT